MSVIKHTRNLHVGTLQNPEKLLERLRPFFPSAFRVKTPVAWHSFASSFSVVVLLLACMPVAVCLRGRKGAWARVTNSSREAFTRQLLRYPPCSAYKKIVCKCDLRLSCQARRNLGQFVQFFFFMWLNDDARHLGWDGSQATESLQWENYNLPAGCCSETIKCALLC